MIYVRQFPIFPTLPKCFIFPIRPIKKPAAAAFNGGAVEIFNFIFLMACHFNFKPVGRPNTSRHQ